MSYLSLFLSACIMVLSTSAFADDASSEVQIATGSYVARDFSKQPVLLRSDDQGKSWFYQSVIWNNPDASDEDILNTFCASGSCIAAGTYKDENDRNLYPLLIYTTDQGRSWSYAELLTKTPMTDGRLYTSYCLEDKCVAAGEVGSHYDDYHRLPLIMFSIDKGKTWDKATIKDINSDDRGVVNAVNCLTVDKCMAAGSVILADKKKKQLIMFTSRDGGRYWQPNYNITNLPSSMIASTVNAIICHNKSCLASGNYETSDNSRLPMILKSNNGGDNWQFISSIKNFPDDYHNTLLNKLSCNNNDCVISGINNASLLTIVSHDKGTSWSYLQENIFPQFMKYPKINSVTFVDNTCIMIGDYHDNQDKNQLLFLISKDGGHSWTGMPKIEDFPSKWRKNISFDSMHCSGKNCFIAGSYDDQPMLLTSHDGAVAWAMTKEENIFDLPSFMEGVKLSSLVSVR